jgi:hypothetical protein
MSKSNSMKYAVLDKTRTIALFLRRIDAREFSANLEYEEGRMNLVIVRLPNLAIKNDASAVG